jgi:hypothetical protein
MNGSPTTLAEPLMSAAATPKHLLGFLVAYLRLLTACNEAREQGLSPRDSPVEYGQFRGFDVGNDVLVWMLFQAHLDHFQAAAGAAGSPDWALKPSAVVGDGSAFSLTPLGEAFGELLVGSLLIPEGDEEFAWAWGLLRVGNLTPRYDREDRLFSWGRHLLKCYRQPSETQETILLAAEELGWSRWFDDPLPHQRNGNAKVRLHDTIKRLNRHQSPHLVRFKGDGTGTRVGWELR